MLHYPSRIQQFAARAFQHELIMHLQRVNGLQFFPPPMPRQTDHGQLNNISRGTLMGALIASRSSRLRKFWFDWPRRLGNNLRRPSRVST